MSRENVEVLEQVAGAIAEGDVDRLLRLAAEDVVWIGARSPVEGVYRGHDGLRKFCADNAESFELFRPEVGEVRDLGEQVLVVGTIHLKGRGSGMESDIPVAGVATFEQGKLTRWEHFRDRRLALEAVGLRE